MVGVCFLLYKNMSFIVYINKSTFSHQAHVPAERIRCINSVLALHYLPPISHHHHLMHLIQPGNFPTINPTQPQMDPPKQPLPRAVPPRATAQKTHLFYSQYPFLDTVISWEIISSDTPALST